MLIVNTRTPKDTATSVDLFYKFLKKDEEEYKPKMLRVGQITRGLANSIQLEGRSDQIQKLICENHSLLSEFELSSVKLEEAREIFRR